MSQFDRDQPYTMRELLAMAMRYRREIIAAHLVGLLIAAVTLPIPLLLPVLVDEVLLGKPGMAVAVIDLALAEGWRTPTAYVTVILGVILLLNVVGAILGVMGMRLLAIVSKNLVFAIREQLLSRLERVAIVEYEALGSGALASLLVTDMDTLDRFISKSAAQFFMGVLSVLGVFAILFWMNWQLATMILLLNPVVLTAATVLGRAIGKLKAHENHSFEVFQEALAETLAAIQQIRASGRGPHYFRRIVDAADQVRICSISSLWKGDAAYQISVFLILLGFELFKAATILMVIHAGLSIGQMLAVFAYLAFVIGPTRDVIGIHFAYHNAQAALARINRVFLMPIEPRGEGLRDPFSGQSTVSIGLQDVSFSYQGKTPVLDRINLQVRAGEKVALVGVSGGGKTTLVQLLLGLYQPASGVISYNGVPIQEIGLPLVRAHVSSVLQTPALFNDTVRDNLCMGETYPEPVLWHALTVAQLGDFVRSLPDGLDTVIGKAGVRLSGGQRQRLSIARMILTDPKVIILDEATSALDGATERQFFEQLLMLFAGRTMIIVAHRLSAVRYADRVIVFDHGRVVEEGAHEELLRRGGRYSHLYG